MTRGRDGYAEMQRRLKERSFIHCEGSIKEGIQWQTTEGFRRERWA